MTTHQLARSYFICSDKAHHRLLDRYRLAAFDRAALETSSGSAPGHWALGFAGSAVLAAHRALCLVTTRARVSLPVSCSRKKSTSTLLLAHRPYPSGRTMSLQSCVQRRSPH
ncbi:hypothetical protein DI270_024285 [Microbispora triticiradicis]|uniref:Uncharacterized protein n=1 Tax=Microbispora triticiradicis TaxID=2200763 RepID=A0ABX9LEP0_9ACTN|nr:hypothetical protein DI270_024285 [Microbispora triticiradicis]